MNYIHADYYVFNCFFLGHYTFLDCTLVDDRTPTFVAC